ncbi:hypothetical protein [Pectinatus brassicae]|uniref:Uncharacterized protein n=1 Tax=Pectinatus brassicae TaxID=862415 RepID=A0A840UK52_9FIRM|nr:hypothetical protein [Pectinatus brassicae]MBB5335078.1 hypothetical protein [Pectinatus brassicae]
MPDFDNTPYAYNSLIENADNKHVASSQNVYSNDLTGNIVYLNGTNLTININQALPGSNDPALQNKPLYVVYANKDGMINLHVSADTVRPLVIYYLGATVNYNPSSSGIYRGVIYTPNAQLWVNENRADFRGSIYAKTFYSQVSGTYVYKAYSDNKSSGGSSIKLVDDDE